MSQLLIKQIVVKENGVLKSLNDKTTKELQVHLNKIPNVGFKEQRKSNIHQKNVRIDASSLPI